MTENQIDHIEEQIFHFKENKAMFQAELQELLAVEHRDASVLKRIHDTRASINFISTRVCELTLQRTHLSIAA